MTTLYEGAFAKLNLTLDVLGLRDDGYHDLKSVMQTVSVRDDIDSDGGYRGAKRIVFSNDGLIYYTEDHYESFELLYGEE